MKVNVPRTCRIALICVLAFGILQHAASAADERQTLQALSKSFALLAQEAEKVVVGIQAERSDENRDRDPRFEGWERFSPGGISSLVLAKTRGQGEGPEDYFFDPDPYRERRERRRNVIPEDLLPNEIRHEINFWIWHLT